MKEKAITLKHSDNYSRVTWKINNFSALAEKKYYSDTFVIRGCFWRIIISPKGINESDCIIVRLGVTDSGSLPFGWSSRSAKFSVTLINQINQVLSLKKETEHNFHSENVHWWIVSFLPLRKLHDRASGFVVDDTCIVEALISNENAKPMVKSKSQKVPEKITVEEAGGGIQEDDASMMDENKMEATEDMGEKNGASSCRKGRDKDEMAVSNEENLKEKEVTKKRRTTCGVPMDSLVQTKDPDEGFATLFEKIGREVRCNPPHSPNELGISECFALLKEFSTMAFSDLPVEKRIKLTSVLRVLTQDTADLSSVQTSAVCNFSNKYEDLCQSCDSSISVFKTTHKFLDSKDDCLKSFRRLDQSQLKIKGDIGVIRQDKEKLLKQLQKLEESESELLGDYMAVGREAEVVMEKWDALIIKNGSMLEEREKATKQKASVESMWSSFISLFR